MTQTAHLVRQGCSLADEEVKQLRCRSEPFKPSLLSTHTPHTHHTHTHTHTHTQSPSHKGKRQQVELITELRKRQVGKDSRHAVYEGKDGAIEDIITGTHKHTHIHRHTNTHTQTDITRAHRQTQTHTHTAVCCRFTGWFVCLL